MAVDVAENQTQEAANDTVTLTGVILKVLRYKEDSGFALFLLETSDKKQHKLFGVCPDIKAGMTATAEGNFHTDSRFGEQFNYKKIELEAPNDVNGIVRYLSSGVLPGVGEGLAQRMVEAFGDTIYDVISNEPYKLLRISGFTEKRVAAIEEAWTEERSVREVRTFLMQYGVGPATSLKVCRQIENVTVDMIRNNPYLLSGIDGIGFKTADRVAKSLEIPEDSAYRISSSISYILRNAEGHGHNYLKLNALSNQTQKLLGDVSADIIARQISSMSLRGEIDREVFNGEVAIYSKNMGKRERESAKRIAQISWSDHGNEIDVRDEDIAWYEAKKGIKFSDSQRQALKTSLGNKFSVLTGGPGTGKTTIVDAYLEISARYCNREVSLAAPTGRATQRMAESTNKEAKTIHKLLKAQTDGQFMHNKLNPLTSGRLVFDEYSMVGQALTARLLAAINDDANILLVGDTDQLPSIEAGRVLLDIINSGEIPVSRLTEVHRQAQDSKIVMTAHAMVKGDTPELSRNMQDDLCFVDVDVRNKSAQDAVVKAYLTDLPEMGFDRLRDIQILTPMHKGSLGTQELNARIQKEINPNVGKGIKRMGGFELCLGDKVMQTTNDSKAEISNGDIGYVTHVDQEGMKLKVDFGGREVEIRRDMLDNLTLGYAKTIHKSQGSEYPAVIMPMTMEHSILLRRELAYTGLTRAKKKAVLMGDIAAFNYAVENHAQDPRLLRNSHLDERIRMAMEELRNDKAANMRPLLGASGRGWKL